MPKSFHELTEKEILALAISLEEEDGRIYGEFVGRMRPKYPKTAETLEAMREEESGHRHRLTELAPVFAAAFATRFLESWNSLKAGS
jgi:rubrerythrin